MEIRKLQPGDFVERDYDQTTKEVGIVVAAWPITERGDQDCYVAFYGEKWPKLDSQPETPYILRYYASGLRLVQPDFEG